MTDLDTLKLHLDTLKLRRRVAQLIAPWNKPDSPGVAAGVVRGGELVVEEQAGMASLELGVPIGKQTTFRIASVSKQFTCAAILMLAEEGRLRVDDDVHQYIPELPHYGDRITLDHLMHNTSGLRDMLEIMRAGGADLSIPVRPQDLMDGIMRQRTLNFAPGSRYLYSNTNFLLLGRVVERVSGEKLRDFLQRRIFDPAGMSSTCMVESTTEVVRGLATGYFPAPGGGWMRAQHGFPLHGEGALVSCVADLALWHRNYSTGAVGGPALLAALAERAPFNNGRLNTYARGLQVTEVRGQATISHGGLWPGYKTEFLRIPGHDAAVIVIANNAVADPYAIGQQIMAAIVEGAPGLHPVPPLPGAEALGRWAGRFLDRDAPATVDIAVSDGGVLTGSTNGLPFSVRAEEDGRLTAARTSRDFTMRLSEDGESLEVEQDAGVSCTYRRIATGAALPADLPGAYRSPEMAATWTIAEKGGAMSFTISGPVTQAGPWEVEPVEGDIIRLISPSTLYRGWYDARVLRNSAGAVTGLVVNGNRVKNLRLDRQG